MIPVLISVRDGAKKIGIKPVTLRKWIYDGRISFFRLGSRVLLREDDLIDFISKNYHPARKEKNNV